MAQTIPLPPLEEQRRIVARVEALMERIREAKRLRQEAQRDADHLMAATLAEVFPRPDSELPKGWRRARLGEVCWRDSSILYPRNQPSQVFRHIGLEQVSPNQWHEPDPIELMGWEIKSQVVAFRPGQVLYGKLRPYLNKVVVPSYEGVASTEFVLIAVLESALLPQYLGAYLRSPDFVAYATQNTTGSRQPRVSLDALWNALIPLPPLDEQQCIVVYLQAMQARVNALKAAQAHMTSDLPRLEAAILDRAFRGEL